jgi:hypothetical protein
VLLQGRSRRSEKDIPGVPENPHEKDGLALERDCILLNLGHFD